MELWSSWLSIADRPARARIRHCEKLVGRYTRQLSQVFGDEANPLLATVAQAHSFMGNAMSEIGDLNAEDILISSVLEAFRAGYPLVCFYCLQGLALFYQKQKDYESAVIVHMITGKVISYLDSALFALLIERLAFSLSYVSKFGDVSAMLYEWSSFVGNSPVHSMYMRCKRLADSGADELLLEELIVADDAPIWEIARGYAASKVLGDSHVMSQLLQRGSEAAERSGNLIWIRSFEHEQGRTRQ
jgi:hypothetical protein